MQFQLLVDQMRANARRIEALAGAVSLEQARWKPRPEDWSILEVVNHVYDEEREDFRLRLDITLHRPSESWPPIDPPGWVTARAYLQRDLGESLQRFLAERQTSLAWLENLDAHNWEASVQAPWGRISAGDLMTSWANHDTLHMRQLVELLHAWSVRLGEPYSPEYAGTW